MRTESDLLSVFRALEDVADSYGTPDFGIATTQPTSASRVGRPSRVRLVVSSLAVAAAVAAIAILAVSTLTPSTHDRTRVGTPGPSSTHTTRPATVTAPRRFDLHALWFTLRPMTGVVVTGHKLFSNAQQIALETSSGHHWDVTLSAAGTARPKASPGSQPISIGGRDGFYGYLSGLPFTPPADQPVGLVWEYAPGAWATVVSADQTAISSTDATPVANAVEPGRAQAVRIPIKLGAAPPGMQLQGYVGGIGSSRDTQHGTERVNALIDFTSGAGTTFTVDLEQRLAAETYTGTATTVSGRTAYIVDKSITILVEHNYVAHVSAMDGGPALTTAQVLAVARSMVIARELHDQRTWFDAATALP